MKLLHLIRHRKLAYELLSEYEYERDRQPIDLEAWKKRMIDSGYFAERIDTSGLERWRAAIERHVSENLT